ncbi:hypothetical protein HPB47_003002 [Ixodes persulcatus]|uniref:Uncharacterized protein n=1 Tax=Ixodes persulcatus TaxID=34615 RepID=A0AC60PL90_IXOPE|nr:hypothetical protein HPB47_003002 [Ixodes persulcatus]
MFPPSANVFRKPRPATPRFDGVSSSAVYTGVVTGPIPSRARRADHSGISGRPSTAPKPVWRINTGTGGMPRLPVGGLDELPDDETTMAAEPR